MWLVILFGLEVSAIMQTVHGGRFAVHGPLSAGAFVLEPTTVVQLMEVVAKDFYAGKSSTFDELMDEASLPESVVEEITAQLLREKLIHEVAGEHRSFTLAKDPESMDAQQIIQVAFDLADRQQLRRSALTDRLRQVQRQSVHEDTLASLVGVNASRG